MTIRVMVVDASAVARKAISDALAHEAQLEVVGTASNASLAWPKMQRLRPDVITLDGADGAAFIKRYMAAQPTPTVVFSSHGQSGGRLAVEAKSAGVSAVIVKPSTADAGATKAAYLELRKKVKEIGRSRIKRASAPTVQLVRPLTDASGEVVKRVKGPDVIGIGVSTGGAAALLRIVPHFPVKSPPIVIVDHMPAGFTADFAKRLDAASKVSVSEAVDGALLLAGHAYIAPGGDRHMTIIRQQAGYRVKMVDGPKVSDHRPSVDELFRSIAKAAGKHAAAALLTGMGHDGARGLLALRGAGAQTVAQDEETCVVYGMPKAAVALGAAVRSCALDAVPGHLLRREAS